MTTRVHVLRGLLGQAEREVTNVDTAGMTLRDLRERMRTAEWKGVRLAIACEGHKLREEELDAPVDPEREYVVCPDLQGIETFAIIGIGLLLSAASAYYTQQQTRKLQRKLQQAQERGDVQSPVYAWDGIATNYGVGFPVPIAYGEHDLGGQVIHQAVYIGGVNTEVYETVLAFSEGRVHSIGGVAGGVNGEADNLGSLGPFPEGAFLPTDIRVNGVKLDATNPTPGAKVSLRMGETEQTPFSQIGSTSSVLSVNQELNTVGASYILSVPEPNAIRQMTLLIAFPAGLYKNGASGNPEAESVTFVWEYRLDSSMAWIQIKTFSVAPTGPRLTSFTHQEFFTLGLAVPGPLETRLRRTVTSAGDTSVSQATWRQTVVILDHVFSYPGVSCMALQLIATDTLYGSEPQIRVRGKWKRVRVYGVAGETGVGLSSSEYWDLPASGDPYFGVWSNPPGRNPAWIFLDFLLGEYGLKNYISTLSIDFDAIRDWADYCDMNLADGRPRYTCDIVFDRAQSAWDTLQDIASTGRATPYIKGSTISVWYQYADAHGRGSNSVAARTRTQLFTTRNIESLQIDYLPNTRPTVIDVQFLNSAKEFAQDVVSIEDPDASNLNNQYKLNAEKFRRETIQLRGVTRSSQARREALYMHRANRLIKTQATLKVGPEALAAEIGDVIGVQDFYFRPYDKEQTAARITSASGTVSTVTLDVPIAVVSTDNPQLIVRQQDGTITTVSVTNATGTVAAGASVTLGASVTVYKGAPAAFGAQDKVVKDYQVVNISTTPELRREIVALEWHPEVHTEPSSIVDEGLDDFEESTDYEVAVTPQTSTLVVKRAMAPGTYVIGWEVDPAAPRRTVRAYARRSGDAAWTELGTSDAGTITTTLLVPGVTYEIATTRAANDLSFANVPASAQITYTADEWPAVAPPNPQRFRATALAEGVLLEWDAVDGEGVEYYELRRGPFWVGGEMIYRGTATRFFWDAAPAGAYYFHLRARGVHGLYSQSWTPYGVTWGAPSGMTLLGIVSVDDLTTTPPGTLTDLTYDGTAKTLRIADGKLEGTYVSSTIDLTVVANVLWTTRMDAYQEDAEDLEEWDFDVDSGEAMWRTVEARESSTFTPGSDLELMVDDLGMDIEDLTDDYLVGGRVGQVGARARAKLEVDYDTTGAGAWTGYRPLRVEKMTAQKARVRLTLTREDAGTQMYCSALQRGVYY